MQHYSESFTYKPNPMKQKSLTLLLPLMAIPFSESPETTEAFPATSSEIVAEENRFGGKRAQNKRNRRTRRINRKNGVGMLPVTIWKEVNHG
jgi:hypothetical protein